MSKLNKWKPVTIDNESVFGNIDGLIGIEVLEPEKQCSSSILIEKTGVKRKKEVPKNKSKKQKLCHPKTCVEAKNDHIELETDEKSILNDMVAWRRHGIRPEVLKALHEKGYLQPTDIQQCCIHAAVTSKKSDIIGAAETGSGKTYAFGIPIVQDIIAHKQNMASADNRNPLSALIVTPTRELAVQVKDHLLQLCKYTDVKVALVVGGLAKEKQERLLKKCPDIVVGTPGRIWELVGEGNPHLQSINKIRMLVIDEADRMLEKKHFAELGELLERMNLDPVFRDERRNFVFSATLTVVHDPPSYHKGHKMKPKQKLQELLGKIGVKNQLVYDLSGEKVTPETLSEWKIQCTFQEKDYYLVYFLQQNKGRTIVFCNSIGCVRRLANILTILKFKPLPLHANMEQKQRLKNLERFRDNANSLLLATDVAARGLDIPQVGHVVHYQVPRTAESYIHRSGRTARSANTGASLLLVSVEEVKMYRKVMKTLRRESGVEDLDVSLSELNRVKKLVNCARDIDQASLALKKKTSTDKWYEKAVKDMDLLLDEDELPKKTSDYALKNLKKDLALREKELDRLLNNPDLPRSFSGKFPDINVSVKKTSIEKKDKKKFIKK